MLGRCLGPVGGGFRELYSTGPAACHSFPVRLVECGSMTGVRMADLIFIVLIIGVFAVLAQVLRGVERL